jgi:hypothetical protein
MLIAATGSLCVVYSKWNSRRRIIQRARQQYFDALEETVRIGSATLSMFLIDFLEQNKLTAKDVNPGPNTAVIIERWEKEQEAFAKLLGE